MDIWHAFSCNPLRPVYRLGTTTTSRPDPAPSRWVRIEPEPITPIGHHGDGFSFDNEGPRHDVLVHPFDVADRLVTEGDWRDFVDDGGYERAGAVAVRRVGRGAERGLDGAVVPDRDGYGWSGVHARRHSPGARVHAGRPHQLLRGRIVR